VSKSLVAYEPCGCCAGISVLTGYETYAYKFAAQEAKAGLRIVEEDTETWREDKKRDGLYCADHAATHGPPWWKSNGGKGKRPADWQKAPAGLW
jgi:hypothetical protein